MVAELMWFFLLNRKKQSEVIMMTNGESEAMDATTPPPPSYEKFKQQFPAVNEAYESLGRACHHTGPLSPKTRELIKMGIAIGANLESATRAHVRLAREAGATPEEIRHAAVLATTTLGYPSMMRGMAWVNDVLEV